MIIAGYLSKFAGEIPICPRALFLSVFLAASGALGKDPAPEGPREKVLTPPFVLSCAPFEARREAPETREAPRFLPDRPFSLEAGYGFGGGEGFRRWDCGIWGGPGEIDLFTSGRLDPGSYRFAIREGRYLVSLGFCETMVHAAGLRVFDVLLQGELAFEALDPFGMAGFGQAFRLSRGVEVKGGEGLSISFRKRGSAPPLVNAICVFPDPGRADPPRPPADFRGFGSYGMNALFWRHREDAPIQGYLVERRGPSDRDFSPLSGKPVPTARWIDRDVLPGASYGYRIRTVDLEGRRSEASEVLSLMPRAFGDSTIPTYFLDVSAESLRGLLSDVKGSRAAKGTFTFHGRSYPVTLKPRGQSTRNSAKLSYRLRFTKESPFPGRRVTYLKAEPFDHTLQAEKLTCDVFRAMGIPVSEASHVNLCLNGEYRGVYLDIEPVRKEFLKRAGLDPRGSLIRVDSFQRMSGDGGKGGRRDVRGHRKLSDFFSALNSVDRGELEAFLRSAADWKEVLGYLVASEVCHRSEIESSDTFYHRDPKTSRWLLIPWDFNNGNFGIQGVAAKVGEPFLPLFGQSLQGTGPGNDWWYVLPSRIFDDQDLRREYLDRLEEAARDFLLSGKIDALIDGNRSRIESEAPLDPFRWPPGLDGPFRESSRELKRFARRHGERLLDLIAEERGRIPPPVVVSEFQFGPEMGWVELQNRSGAPVSLEGFSLAGGSTLRENRRRFQREDGIDAGAFKICTFQRRGKGEREGPPGFDPQGGILALLGPSGEKASGEGEPEGPRERIQDLYFYGPRTPGFSYGRSGESFGSMRPSPGSGNGPLLPSPPLLWNFGTVWRGDEPLRVTALIQSLSPADLPCTIALRYLAGGRWAEAPMEVKTSLLKEPGGGLVGQASVSLPAGLKMGELCYYFVARSLEGIERPAPPGAPEDAYRSHAKGDD